MKKHSLEWLEELPEPYRAQAIENYNNNNSHDKSENECTLVDAISAAFVWKDTPEGHDYWSKLSKQLEHRYTIFDLRRAFEDARDTYEEDEVILDTFETFEDWYYNVFDEPVE